MNDELISRAAAFDSVEIFLKQTDAPEVYPGLIPALERVINNVPSAQPEIVRCKVCKHHWTHRCMDSMPTEICELDQTFYDANVDFCSLAERRTDEGSD